MYEADVKQDPSIHDSNESTCLIERAHVNTTTAANGYFFSPIKILISHFDSSNDLSSFCSAMRVTIYLVVHFQLAFLK
jgi:hypothetical protein